MIRKQQQKKGALLGFSPSCEGGVTGSYIVAGFNPDKERANFQKVYDYILDRRAEFLGQARENEAGRDAPKAMEKLKQYAIELGLDPGKVLAK